MGLKILKNFKKNIYWRINKYSLSHSEELRYIIKSRIETMEKLLGGYSISRYGDGELSLIYKKKKNGINYQEDNLEMRKRLAEILLSNLKNHIVGIPGPLIKVDDLIRGEAYFWSKYYYTNKKNLNKHLSKTKIYYDQMILIALGPTATILAYDLAKEGYQAVDIGHMDIEYEWYLRKADRKIDIENKAVNEVSGVVDKEIKDEELKKMYESQIIDKISLD